MKTLQNGLKAIFDNINKSSKGIKARLRPLKAGGFSIYLDIHSKTKPRFYEKTEFHLYNLPDFKEEDKQTLKELNLMMKMKENDNYKKSNKSDILVIDWMLDLASKKGIKYSLYEVATNYFKTMLHEMNKTNLTFKELNFDICQKYYDFINKLPLKINSKRNYFKIFKSMLSKATEIDLIPKNYAAPIKTKSEETIPDYLTKEELLTLINTPTKYHDMKNAFLFSCFTALRFSDLKQLKFSMIHDSKLNLIQQKTKNMITNQLSKDALHILNEQKLLHPDEEFVFHLPTKSTTISQFKSWLRSANLLQPNRHLSLHSARHTAAMQMLDNQVPIQIISKILGHKSLSTTMIYQKISDKYIEQAMNDMPSFLT